MYIYIYVLVWVYDMPITRDIIIPFDFTTGCLWVAVPQTAHCLFEIKYFNTTDEAPQGAPF